ncbi:MAG: hypothetical protein ACOC2C_03810 [Cyclonatronaceae bacterium]
MRILLLSLLFALTASAQPSGDTVYYVFTEIDRLEDGRLTTTDEAEWRIMQQENRPEETFEQGAAVIIVLGAQREGRGGMAYIGGERLPVSLVGGSPERERGRRHSLLLADAEHRRLTLVNGDVRRVMDPDISLDFPGDRLVELILTADRQHLLDTSRGLKIRVSPVVR